MKVEVRKEVPSRAVLEVEVSPEVVSRGIERALARLNQRVEIPGFRRGKAPKTLLERYVGKETIHDETVKQLVPEAYDQAVGQAGVKPIARPEIQIDPLEEGKPLRFVATVDLVPEVRLGEYRAIRIAPIEAAVTEADIAAAVEDLRARHAHLVTVGDRRAEAGDYVLVRTAEAAGSQNRFLAGKEYLIELGSQTSPLEVETALTGATAGRRVTVAVQPDATVTFEVVDVKRRELPAVSDEFARTAGDVASVQELRESLRSRMEGEAKARAQQEYEQKVVDALLEVTAVEVPVSLVDHEIAHLVADLTDSLQRRGMTLERYLEVTEKTEDQLREELRPGSERRLRTQLAVDEVARRDGLEPSEEEINREAENVARKLQQEPARVREWLAQTGRLDSLVAALRRQKALVHLIAIAQGPP